MPLPVRSAGNTRADHLSDHNALRALHNLLTPATDYGLATGNTAKQNAAALQAQINANGGFILLPAGTYQVDPLALKGHYGTIQGAGADKTRLICPAGNLFSAASYITGWRFAGFRATTRAGDIFTGGFVGCLFTQISLDTSDPNGHIVYHDSSAPDFSENVFLQVQAQVTPAHNVPAFDLRGPNTVNLNQWIGGRYTYSGDYVFHLEGTSNQAFLSNNTWRGVNFEVTTGGNIRLLSCLGSLIETCGTYDTHAIGPIAKDLYYIGAGKGGLKSQYTTMTGNIRHGGTFARDVVDVRLAGVRNTIMQNCGTTSSNYAVHVGADSTSALHAINAGVSATTAG